MKNLFTFFSVLFLLTKSNSMVNDDDLRNIDINDPSIIPKYDNRCKKHIKPCSLRVSSSFFDANNCVDLKKNVESVFIEFKGIDSSFTISSYDLIIKNLMFDIIRSNNLYNIFNSNNLKISIFNSHYERMEYSSHTNEIYISTQSFKNKKKFQSDFKNALIESNKFSVNFCKNLVNNRD